MSLNEFDIIQQYFSSLTASRKDVMTAIGDDCALLYPEPGKILAVSTDTLVSGRHFFAEVDPLSLGHKCLAVNLSDLAAMGAKPCWVSLALTLPEVNPTWLEKFAQGFAALAQQYDLQLIGGDTTGGPLAITVTIHGQLEPQQAITRDKARPGDLLCVTGTLGEASLALQQINNNQDVNGQLRKALDWPSPRIETGRMLSGLASSCIDLSDGLLADLGHICEASACGALIEKNRVPGAVDIGDEAEFIEHVLSGGDDYELCFTVAPESVAQLDVIAEKTGVPITVVGRMVEGNSIQVIDYSAAPGDSGRVLNLPNRRGFDHFS